MDDFKFDFAAARFVALVKFREICQDVKVHEWISNHATVVGSPIRKACWQVKFLVFPAAGSAGMGAGESGPSIAFHKDRVVLSEDGADNALVVFDVILDGGTGHSEIVSIADFSILDFDLYQ